MRCAHAELPTGRQRPEIGRNGHLVALHPPHLQNTFGVRQQRIFGALVEDRTAIGTVVLADVQTRRVRLRKEYALVVLGAQNRLQELEVIDLLQADNVRIGLDDLLHDQVLAVLPGERFLRAADEAVVALAKS